MQIAITRRVLSCAPCVVVLAVAAANVGAQEALEQSDEEQTAASSSKEFRKLAPGVEIVVEPRQAGEETYSRHDLVEILVEDPQFGQRAHSQKGADAKEFAKEVVFSHDVWSLKFSFKPVRFIKVELPTKAGGLETKTIWYMVYHVEHSGQIMKRSTPQEGALAGQSSVEMTSYDKPIRFRPRFLLEGWDSLKNGRKHLYPDRFIPLAIPEIQKREDANRALLSKIEASREIPAPADGVESGLWGVVTWIDVNPKIDHFSIYIQGLTNAYRWIDGEAPGSSERDRKYVYKAGDPPGTGRKLLEKTLRLNFWRPSDAEHEHEDEIRFGYWEHEGVADALAPEDRVDYRWFFCNYDDFRPAAPAKK